VIVAMTRRGGFSLIEMLAVMTTAAVLTGIAVGILYGLMRLEKTSRRQIARRVTMTRLSDQFRRDARSAREFTAPEAGAQEGSAVLCRFSLDEGRMVEYRAEAGAVSRTARAGDEVLDRDTFTLAEDATVTVQRIGDAEPGVLRLRIVPPAGAPEESPWRVDALLAKDRRFVEENNP
jgi:prepilin-type N-terminal cleavage/methylation domain-containing protein